MVKRLLLNNIFLYVKLNLRKFDEIEKKDSEFKVSNKKIKIVVKRNLSFLN